VVKALGLRLGLHDHSVAAGCRPEECRGILVKPGLGSAARISSGPGASKGPVKHTLILSPLKGKSGVAMMSKPMVEVKMRT